MKVVTYSFSTPVGENRRLGILLDETKIFDPNLFWRFHYQDEGRFNPISRANKRLPPSLFSLLNSCDNPLALLQETLEAFKLSKIEATRDGLPLVKELSEDFKLRAPLDRISTYRDFYAHEKHVAKGFEKRGEPIPEAWYEIPAYYKGPTTGFIGTEETVLWPRYSKVLDFELELGMVVGREGKNIKSSKALEHIFGFTILNDISARDIQKKEMSVRLGPAKGKDFCSVIGPVITTIDEFGFKEPNLKMTATINGEKWSEGQSGDAHFNFSQMIEHVSQDEWVLAGDLFGSGTVGTGCGLELDKWIQPGDDIELWVESIGSLRNKVGTPQGEK